MTHTRLPLILLTFCLITPLTLSTTPHHTNPITPPPFTITPGPGIIIDLNTSGTVNAEQLLWTANTTGTNYEESIVAVKDHIAYIGSCATHGAGHNHLYAVDTNTGDILWSYPTGPGYVGPTIVGDTIYYGTCTHGQQPDNETLYALNRITGDLQWSIPVYGGIAETIQADTHNLYFGTG